MKRTQLAVFGLTALAAASAQAQSSVTVFGLLDMSLAHFSADGNNSQTALATDGYQSSRIGFRGVEDLGGGLKAGFWLEAGLAPDDGEGAASNANNQAISPFNTTTGANAPVRPGTQGITFNRRSTVSLLGNWGEVRLGRDFVPGFWNLTNFSPFGTNGVGSSAFLFYPVQGAARVTNIRASNSIGYFLPAMGGFYGQAMYAFGENPSNAGATEDDGKVAGLRLGYAAGPFDVAIATTRTKISSVGDLTQSNIGGAYDFGMVKPMALYNENKVGSTRTKSWLLGALVPVGPGQIRLAYSNVSTTGVANDADQWALGYVHNLSKRTALYANWSRVNNDGGTNYNVGRPTTVVGGSSQGYELGIRHSF